LYYSLTRSLPDKIELDTSEDRKKFDASLAKFVSRYQDCGLFGWMSDHSTLVYKLDEINDRHEIFQIVQKVGTKHQKLIIYTWLTEFAMKEGTLSKDFLAHGACSIWEMLETLRVWNDPKAIEKHWEHFDTNADEILKTAKTLGLNYHLRLLESMLRRFPKLHTVHLKESIIC
jgi:hypothetical protein